MTQNYTNESDIPFNGVPLNTVATVCLWISIELDWETENEKRQIERDRYSISATRKREKWVGNRSGKKTGKKNSNEKGILRSLLNSVLIW